MTDSVRARHPPHEHQGHQPSRRRAAAAPGRDRDLRRGSRRPPAGDRRARTRCSPSSPTRSSVVHPEAAPKLIMPFEIKRDVIEGLGVDELVVIPFDHEFSTIPPEEFCSRILIETLGAERVSVGENFRFGARAKGDPDMLASSSEFETRVVPWSRSTARSSPRRGSGRWSRRARSRRRPGASAPRSCSRGRWSRGTAAAASSASRPPTSSPPTTWCARATGSTRRSPTASPAAVNVGVRPTFETGRGLLVEAYLIDFEGDLYGQIAADRLHQPAAGRAAVSGGRGPGRADASRRRGGPRALC